MQTLIRLFVWLIFLAWVVQVAFILLKLCRVIGWSWLHVSLPVLITFGWVGALALTMVVIHSLKKL